MFVLITRDEKQYRQKGCKAVNMDYVRFRAPKALEKQEKGEKVDD
jgi:hypothetical protein